MFCENCRMPIPAHARFCPSCGADLDSGKHQNVAGAGSESMPDETPVTSMSGGGSRPPRPPELSLVAALLALCGAVVAFQGGTLVKDVIPLLRDGAFGRGLGTLALVSAMVFGGSGLGLVAVAWLLAAGDRVGRMLGIAVCGSVVLAEILNHYRTRTDWIALGTAIGAIVALSVSPRVWAFFNTEDHRPSGVVGGTAVVSVLTWGFALAGIGCIAMHSFGNRFLPEGIALLVGSALLLGLNRPMRAGDARSRAIASVVLIALSVVAVVVNRNSGTYVLAGIAAGALGMLWLPESSRGFFGADAADLPAPIGLTWPWSGERAESTTSAGRSTAAIAVISGVALLTFVLTNTPSSPVDAAASPAGPVSTYSPYVAPPPTYSPYVSPSPTYSPYVAPPAGSFVRSWIITATATGGYSMTAELEVGNPEPFREGIANGSATAGSACSLNAETDAVIPAELILTNVTPGFPATPGITLDGIGSGSIPGFTGPELLWEAQYADGAQCAGQGDGNSSFGVNATNPLGTNETSTAAAFFDITQYYSPDQPNGDPSILGDALLTVPSSFQVDLSNSQSNSTSNAYTSYIVDGVSGPGVVPVDGGWEFSLAGTPPQS
jgi:hypothetical protein